MGGKGRTSGVFVAGAGGGKGGRSAVIVPSAYVAPSYVAPQMIVRPQQSAYIIAPQAAPQYVIAPQQFVQPQAIVAPQQQVQPQIQYVPVPTPVSASSDWPKWPLLPACPRQPRCDRTRAHTACACLLAAAHQTPTPVVAAASSQDDDDEHDDEVAKGIAKFIKRVGKDVSAIGSAVTHQQPAPAATSRSYVPTQTWPAPVPTAPAVQVPVSYMADCARLQLRLCHACSSERGCCMTDWPPPVRAPACRCPCPCP